MRRILSAAALATAVLASSPLPAAPATTPAPPASTAAAQKVIKDPAEYNAYMGALNTADPVAKAAAMEAFIARYPGSVVKDDALEQAMAAYQQAGDQAKTEETAQRILQANPNNVRALAVVVFLQRARATGGDKQALAALGQNAERGLKLLLHWLKPGGLSDTDFARLHAQVTAIFYGAAGFSALQVKDYPKARSYYLKSVTLDSGNLQDAYQLGVAELEMSPLDKDGFWYICRAAAIAAAQGNSAAQQQIEKYGAARYRKFHGSDAGWDKIMAATQTAGPPPADFAAGISAAPTPAEIAVKAVQESDPASLSFSDWEYVLGFRDASPANKQAADKVWKTLRGKEDNGKTKLKIPVLVLAATTDSIDAAITDDNQQAKKTDLHVKLSKSLASPPAAGSSIYVVGVITDYRLNPFAFTMQQAEVTAAEAAPPAGTAH
jgi:hypothetical protein